MPQVLASGKTGSQRYADLDATKPCPDLDDITLIQNLQNSYEETQGYSLCNNKGNSDSIDTQLDEITLANVSTYNNNLSQLIQTYIANNSYLDVDAASTGNNIILLPRKIADINSPNGSNYSKPTSLPFAYRDNLRFTFRATANNTGPTQFTITGLNGLVGAKDIVDEGGFGLIGGEIISGRFYDIALTGTGGTQKAVLVSSNRLVVATESLAGIAPLPKQITIANNISDANNDIDFSAGNFQFRDGTGIASLSALTKRLDATWVAGTNQGGLFFGSKANSTWYHCFAIYNPSTGVSDCGFDTSLTAANIPSGYTKYKRVGSILTDGSGNIRGFIIIGKFFYFKTPILDINTAVLGTTRTSFTISTPLGIRTIALANIWRGTDDDIYCSSPESTDLAPSPTAAPLSTIGNIVGVSPDSTGFGVVSIATNTSSQIAARASGASTGFRFATLGYIDETLYS